MSVREFATHFLNNKPAPPVEVKHAVVDAKHIASEFHALREKLINSDLSVEQIYQVFQAAELPLHYGVAEHLANVRQARREGTQGS